MSREFLVGRLQMHRDGYGFVVPDNRPDNMRGDLFIPPESTGRGDAWRPRDRSRAADRARTAGPTATIVRVLRRAHATVVGEFLVKRHGCFVKPHDDRIQQWIEIAEGMEIPRIQVNGQPRRRRTGARFNRSKTSTA